LGILITFGFLGALILVIVVLQEIFKFPQEEAMTGNSETDERNVRMADQDDERLKALAAAVAVAALKSDQRSVSRLGQVLETPPGRWWRDARNKE
jgi:Na+-transporting methylmalonyl-CoA/oxaloacetate decarboxylase gamma subunit